MKWLVPVRVVSRADAVIEAPTKREALRKFWAHQWEEQTDAIVDRITKIGPATPEDA